MIPMIATIWIEVVVVLKNTEKRNWGPYRKLCLIPTAFLPHPPPPEGVIQARNIKIQAFLRLKPDCFVAFLTASLVLCGISRLHVCVGCLRFRWGAVSYSPCLLCIATCLSDVLIMCCPPFSFKTYFCICEYRKTFTALIMKAKNNSNRSCRLCESLFIM